MRNFLIAVVLASLTSPLIAAETAPRRIEIHDAWVRVFPNDGSISAYFVIDNPSPEPDRLVGVSSPIAERARIAHLQLRGMTPITEAVSELAVGGYQRVRLHPGGTFIELQRPTRTPAVGESISLSLTFERSGRMDITATVSNQLLGNR